MMATHCHNSGSYYIHMSEFITVRVGNSHMICRNHMGVAHSVEIIFESHTLTSVQLPYGL